MIAKSKADDSSASNRVNRGGSWVNDASYCRAASRYWYVPSGRVDVLGFRVIKRQERRDDQ